MEKASALVSPCARGTYWLPSVLSAARTAGLGLALLGPPAASLAATPADGWRVRFDASLPGLPDKGRLTLGASTASSDGFDTFDDPHPPALPDHFLDVVTQHDTSEAGWSGQALPTLRYRAEYLAPVGLRSHAIDFRLETDQAGPVTLGWAISADLDLAAHFVVLRDVDAGTQVDLWSQSSVALNVVPGVRHLRLELTAGRIAPPVAYDQSVVTNEDTPAPLVLTGADPQGQALAFSIVTAPSNGAVLGEPPNVTYAPNPNFTGSDAFTFRASNGQTVSNVATVSVTILPVNDPPTAQNLPVTTDENTPASVTLVATDPEGDPLAYTVLTQPQHGALSGTAPSLTYTPTQYYFGSDSFTFKANDGQLDSVVATVSLTVNHVNQPPIADFTVPGPARNVALWRNDLASSFAGGSVIASTGQYPGYAPANAIDENPATYWVSANGQTTNQSLTIQLPGGELHTIDRFRLTNANSVAQSVRHFHVQVSATTPADASFGTVLTAQALDNVSVQEFPLSAPVAARFVRLVADDNYGSVCCVGVRSFEAVDSTLGGVGAFSGAVPSVSSHGDATTRPEQMLDTNTSTMWTTANGHVTNEYVKLRLAAVDPPIDRVRIQTPVGTAALRDFDVLVSTTTDGDAAFQKVLSGTWMNDGTLQEFVFPGGPVRARYVELLVKSNYGSPTNISVATFQVLTAPSDGNLVSGRGSVVGFSSQYSPAYSPAQALDQDPGTSWVSNGQSPTQWMKIAHPGTDAWLIDHVALQPRTDAPGDQSPRDFEVDVSTTTADDAAFRPVLSGTLRNDFTLQHFFFPAVDARFVRLLLKTNYGSGYVGIAGFAVFSPQSGSVSARFLDQSKGIDAGLATYIWDFGDGGTSGDRDPAHTYSVAGSYTVHLAVTDGNGLSGSHAILYRAVGQPQASFSVSASPLEGQSATFVDTSTSGNTVVLRHWDFGDGTRVDTSQASVAHTFQDNGTYPVTLTVSDTWGASASRVASVAVANLPPVVQPGPNVKVVVGASATFHPSVADPSPVDAATLSCSWDFGDGQQGQGCAPSHVYAQTGPLVAQVTVVDKDGASTSVGVNVTVYAPQCALPGGVFAEYPYCGSYALADLGSVPSLPASYGGMAFKADDASTLLIASGEITANGGVFTVRVTRDAQNHVTGFAGPATRLIDVPNVDGGLVYGPGGDLFAAQWPTNNLVEIKPGSTKIDKQIAEGPLGVDGISLNFVPPGFPGACSLKLVGFFTSRWWSMGYAPDGQGTFDMTSVREAASIPSSGPEHLIYVPAGSVGFPDRSTVLVTENTAGNLAAYSIDGNGDPIPASRRVVVSGFPGPEAFTIDPLTGDLLVSSLSSPAVKVLRGFAAPARTLALTPASTSLPAGGSQTLTATLADASGHGRAGVPLTMRITTGPNAGAAGTCQPDPACVTDAAGRVLFTYASGGGVGTDSITGSYTSDSCDAVTSAPAQVTWLSDLPPVASDGAIATPEDSAASVALTGVDPAGGALTYAVVAAPSHGTLSGSGANLSYAPAANYNGPDSFTFKVNNGHADSNVATVSITVTPVNDAPVAPSQGVTTPEDTATAIALSATDVEGDPLTYAVVTAPVHGSLSGTAPALTYTPAPDYSGSDSFTFKANDGQADSNVATVSITVTPVNDAPVAASQGVTTPEDTATAFALSATDVEGDPLTYAVVTAPVHGSLSGTAPALTYTPAPDYSGSDSFTFKANDGQADSNVATVSITVTPVNDAPVAASQSVTTAEDTPVAVTIVATDVDGDPLTYALVTSPTHGTLTGTPPSLTYTPTAGYFGSDSFTFKANDGRADSNVTTVSITVTHVNHAPVTSNQSMTTLQDTPAGVTLVATDADGDSLTYAVVTSPAHGALTGTPPSLTYAPTAGYFGGDSFTFKANDGQVDSNAGTVSITVTHVNHAPVAASQSVSTAEDAAKAILLTATDVDGDALTYTVVTIPTHGTLSGTASNLTYTPAGNYNGPDGFTFKANDGQADSNVATVSITVTPVNDAPIANNGSVTTNANTAVAVTLTAADADGDALTYTIVTNPAHGTLTGTKPSLTYTPTSNYTGSDSFTFKANDGQVDSNVATVSIAVNASGGGVVIFEARVSAGRDDAEEKAGTVDNFSGDLDLGFDEGAPQDVGIRFNGVTMPRGATIVNAWVQFMVDKTDSSACSLDIHGEANDNPPDFHGEDNITSRPRTAAVVNWVPPPWTVVNQAGPAQQTPNLASVIQEIVSRAGWTSGNSLVLIITGTGHREAESLDGNRPQGAALLHVEYAEVGS